MRGSDANGPRDLLGAGCVFAAALVGVACLLAGCASEPRHGDGPGGEYGGDARRGVSGRAGLNLFISPSGEPFHSTAVAPYASAEWFAAADTNHDGRLTLEEFKADAARFFHVLDSNHDGVIDGVEVQTYEQTIAPEILPRIDGLRAGEGFDPALGRDPGGRGRRRGVGSAPPTARRIQAGDTRPEGAALYGVLDEPEPVTASDTDFTGRITLDEWLAKAKGRFRLLDANDQGYLTLDGLPKTAAQNVLERLRKRDAGRTSRSPPARSPG